MKPFDISIIIVTYNSEKYISACLESIFNLSDNLKKEIIIVDNNSIDSTKDKISLYKNKVRILENSINSGYAGGNNIGANKANGEFLVFLNPDITVTNSSFAVLKEYLETNTDVGAVGPGLLYPNGTMQQYYCNYYSVLSIFFRRTILGKIFSSYLSHPLQKTTSVPVEIDWILGAFIMIPFKTWEVLGGFDSKYKLYFEDVDLCCRIKKSGLKNIYNPHAVVYHHHLRESASKISKKTLWHIQSSMRFFNKFGWRIF